MFRGAESGHSGLSYLYKEHAMEVTVEKGVLVIRIPMNKTPQPSASGKTLVIASSHGNQPTGATVNGCPVIVGLNAYIKPEKK